MPDIADNIRLLLIGEVLNVSKKMDPELAIIILTGHGSEQAAREGIEQGAFDYLTKPCDLQSLLNVINAAYSQKRSPDRSDA